MPSGEITSFERIYAQRLRYILKICDLKVVELAREYSAQYHVKLSPVIVSYWLNGKRKIPPSHYSNLKTLLASHLKLAATAPDYGLEQELLDWDGLAYNDEQLKREKYRPRPVILGNLPRSSPGAGHFYRQTIRDEIAHRLLNPDPETGGSQPGVVVLTGLPGSGRTEMVLEVLERVAWFFNGGILYADLGSSFKAIWQEWDRRRISHTQVLRDIEKRIRERKGRWLLIAENIQDGKRLQSLLPAEHIWVLATAYGISALQPLGWEEHAFPLKSLTNEEATLWLKTRLGEQWGKPHDRENAHKLRHLSEGLPMAVAILSAQVRSRGWRKVFEALHDPQRAVAYIRYGSRQETQTSSLAKAIDLAFQTLTADEKVVLREMAMYPPGNSVPEELFHHLTNGYQEAVDDLVEKGLLNRFENPRWGKPVLRLHRLVALHARASLPVDEGQLLARMMDFSAFLHLSLPEGIVAESEVFDRLYAQRKMLGFAREFWQQLGDEAKAGRFEPTTDIVIHLNASVRTCTYLTWMNSGAEAALSFLEAMRQMPFITNFPDMDMALPETRSLWADILFALRNTDRIARNGQSVTDLFHPQFAEMGQVARSGDIIKLLSLCSNLLFDDLGEPQVMRFLWIQQCLRMLFRRLWLHQRFIDLQLVIDTAMPFFMAFPWLAGLEARWWDFKATLAARGQLPAQEKLTHLQAYERSFQDALGQADLPYTTLGIILVDTNTGDGLISTLRSQAEIFKRMSLKRVETESHHLVHDLRDGRITIVPTQPIALPSDELLASLEACKDRFNELVARERQKV